jgi:hypothetical protein
MSTDKGANYHMVKTMFKLTKYFYLSYIAPPQKLPSFCTFLFLEINCTFHLRSQFILQHFLSEED